MNIWNDWKSPIAGHQWTRSVHRSRLELAVPVRLFLHYSQGFLKENWHKNVKILLNGSPPDKAKTSNFKFTWWQLLLLCLRQQKWLNVFRKLSFQRLCFWTRYILFFFFLCILEDGSTRKTCQENLSRNLWCFSKFHYTRKYSAALEWRMIYCFI